MPPVRPLPIPEIVPGVVGNSRRTGREYVGGWYLRSSRPVQCGDERLDGCQYVAAGPDANEVVSQLLTALAPRV